MVVLSFFAAWSCWCADPGIEAIQARTGDVLIGEGGRVTIDLGGKKMPEFRGYLAASK